MGDTINRPMAVWVFGILNIILGVLGVVFSADVILQITKVGIIPGVTPGYLKFLLVANTIGFVASIFLAGVGAGLLKIKKWARAGAIFYGWFGIIFFIVEMSVNFIALAFGWFKIPPDGMLDFITGMVISTLGGLVYPVLLLIFMKTDKVKQAFARIENG
jgi:hypothetical protein